MQILFYPYQCEKNKYITIIQKAITELGVAIKPFDLKHIGTLFQTADAVYLNWFDNLSPNPIKASIQVIFKKFLIKYYKTRLIKIIFVMHNKSNHDEKRHKEGHNRSQKFLRWLILNCDRVVILSEKSKRAIKEICGKQSEGINESKVYRIPHPNYIGAYNDSKFYSREKLNITSEDFVFLYMGLVRPYKCIELMINAFKILDVCHAKLVIAGKPVSSKYRHKLEELIDNEPCIHTIFQFIPDDDIISLIGVSDVMIFPFEMESSLNSGSVFLSASNKRTFICSNIAGVQDFENKDDFITYCYTTRGEHQNSLLNAMMYMLELNDCDPEMVKEMGLRMFSMVEKDYSAEKIKEALRGCLYD